MDTINILITSTVSDKCIKQIESVSSSIRVINGFDASKGWDTPDMITRDRKGQVIGGEYGKMLDSVEIIYGFKPPENIVKQAPKLKWVQTMLAGVDHFLDKDLVKSKVIVTNMSGVHASPVSEIALEMMLMLAKQAPFCFYNQVESKWERYIPMLLRSKTVGIIGLGAIGRETARLSKAFGMRVIGTRRSAKKIEKAKNIDVIYPLSQMKEMLAECDFVVLILPSTSESQKIIGEKELRSMKPSAYLVNVGRGDSIDEEAMIKALEKGWIAGAGLDVYAEEPLPASSRLWKMRNVIISPHVAGRLVNYDEIVTKLFCENLTRYINGKRLMNVVNKKRGY